MDKLLGNIPRKLIHILAVSCCMLLHINGAFAQRYTFTHYDIENGLIQSQVNRMYQDNSHRLWMGTLGGASRFDGMDYYSISKATGLMNNIVSAVFCDKAGTVWFGTNKGLTNLKGQKLYNFTMPTGFKEIWVSRLTQDAGGTIWGIMSNHLFKVVGNNIQVVQVAGLPNSVTTITVNKTGQLVAAVRGMGIYVLNGKQWQSIVTLPKQMTDIYAVKLVYDKQNPDRLFVLAYKYLFVVENNTITSYADDVLKDARRPFLSLEQDGANNWWIGTTSGAYCLKQGKLTRFDSHNGFTDASVSDIYNDKDNNLWLGTQGGGVYRYDGDDYLIFDQSSANVKETPIVMALAQDSKQNTLVGIDGGGLASYDGKNLSSIWLDSDGGSYRKVLALYKDHKDTIWIGTSLSGFWKYDGHKFNLIKGTDHNSVFAITEDADNLLWIATPMGIYSYANGAFNAVGVSVHTSALLPLGRDSMLYGTQDGLGLLVNKKPVPNFKINLLGSSAIFCLMKYKNFAIIGTDDQGIYIWDRNNGRVRNYQMKDGLKANSIYSLAADEHGLIWAGTGRGVSRFAINPKTMDCTIFNTGDSKDRIVETNQNAILYHDHKMFIGTTKGLAIYNTDLPAAPSAAPYVIINGIKLYGQGNEKSKILTNPAEYDHMVLPYSQNHVAISFWGVYLKSPETVLYQYRLSGLDDKFCAPVKNDMVDYPSLPPGRYTFEVRAISGEGKVSKNTATFSFEITPPFYRTYIFQLGVILFLIFIGVVIQNVVHRSKIQRQRALEAMKREEKMKIRQQTAEDFHDDLGNKLTRITVLSDILDAKLEKEKTEQKKLVLQIKQNASALYNGTRDILWAMDPKSDNLFEVLNHIKETGIEIFEDTHVEFSMEGISEEQNSVKLPMEYSRNITMIFKELLNNVLKHADAHNVKVEYSQPEKDEARIRVSDDGIGFDPETTRRGHGLNNIKARAKRIGGELTCLSEKGKGAVIELTFRINKRG
ncbi:MAG: two-component regulator propeller domain-containing protein [Bacteroidota bacterium]